MTKLVKAVTFFSILTVLGDAVQTSVS